MRIKEAEAQAQKIITSAQEEAARLIRRAEEEAADAFSRLTETGKRQALEKKQATEAAIRESNAHLSQENIALCEALRQSFLSNKARAIDAIIQIITAPSGAKGGSD
ncbi:MAG: hypothetical protein WDA00_02185 [Eubacteriales bacterium]